MLPDDLVFAISHDLEKIIVGFDDRAVGQKAYHALGPRHGIQNALVLNRLHFGSGRNGSELDHAGNLAARIRHRTIGRFDPNRGAAFGKPPELAADRLAARQLSHSVR